MAKRKAKNGEVVLLDSITFGCNMISDPGCFTLIGAAPSHGLLAVIGLIAAFEAIRNYTLVIGIGGIAGGILLFVNHKRHLDSQLASGANERVKAFESRKFRRRTAASAMITSAGFMMAALYWVSEVKVFSMFILMILTLLIGILGVALVDLFSVGIQQIASPDERSQKAMIEEYLKTREEKASQSEEEQG